MNDLEYMLSRKINQTMDNIVEIRPHLTSKDKSDVTRILNTLNQINYNIKNGEYKQ